MDAALNNVNVIKVCAIIHIRQRSDDSQCVVISLKDMFYERSESLIGIYCDVSSNSSQSPALDLTRFDRKSGEKNRDDAPAEVDDSPKRSRIAACPNA